MSDPTHRCGACGKPSAKPAHEGCIRRLERRERKNGLKTEVVELKKQVEQRKEGHVDPAIG